jgi:23S rRNA pseudouridine1911/1915/1917 synthase
MLLDVIHQDNHLLAVAKPPGLLVQGDRSGDPTLVEAAQAYLKETCNKPGNVYIGLVHRLDRNVSGLVLLARTSKAASRLSAAFREGRVQKRYLAVVLGDPPAEAGELKAWLAAEGDARGVTRTEGAPFAGGREAVLRYRRLERRGGVSLLEVEPVTGRRHQIRAQLALVGCPLLGDIKYGAPERLPDRRLGLHAWQLELDHPVGGAPLTLTAPPDRTWPWPAPSGRNRP